MKRCISLLMGAAILMVATPVHAQLGKVLREGAEVVGKKALGRTAREGAQEGTEFAVRKGAQVLAREAAQESTEAVAKIGLKLSDEAARAAGTHGMAIVRPLVDQFGDDGARALQKLSPANARRVAIMADDFANTGRGADFMKVLADKGDVVAEWLWRNKGAVALGTGAAAFLANPDAFLNVGETVVTTAIETAGKDLARPLIEETAEHVVPSVVERVVAPFMTKDGGPLIWRLVLLAGFIFSLLLVLAYATWCWYVRPWWSLLRIRNASRK